MSSLPTRGTLATKRHQRKPYDRPPPSPAPQLTRTKSGFFNTVKALVSIPISWLSGADTSNTATSNGAAGEGKHLKRRASRNRVDNGEGSRPKRMRTISPPRVSKSAPGYLDPPQQMLRHTISAATFARAGGFKPGFPSNANGDFTQQARESIRDTPLQYSSLHWPQSPSRRTPSVGPWFPQPASTRNSLAPRPSQVHFSALPSLNLDVAIASHDDSRMMSPSPSVSVGVGLGRERTPSMGLPGRESSVAINRMSVSRATGAPLRASLSASNPFASLGKSSSVAPERKKPTLVWDDTLGVTSTNNAETKDTLPPSAKNTAERLLNALENMHTHTGDAQRPRRRPPPSVQVPAPGPSVPSKLKRMIQPYGEVKVSPKAKGKGGQGRPVSGLMKILMKSKKESEAEDMDLEESPKPAESTKLAAAAPQPPADVERMAAKDKHANKAADMDMDSTSTATPALKIIDNFRPASQPPSRPGTSSSLRQSKTITKRAHVPSAGRNRFSANNDDADEEDEEAIERRNAELVAAANASVFKVPEGFKFGGSVTPAPAPKSVELARPDSTIEVISPKPVPAKSTPTPVLSFTPITVPRSDPPPKTAFFSESTGSKSDIPKVPNPFAGLGAGLSKPEIRVPEVPKWGSAPAPSAPTPVAKPDEGVSVFAKIGVPSSIVKPSGGSGPVAPTFSFGKPAETTPAPALVPERSNEPAKPLFGAASGSGFSFGKPAPAPAAAMTGANPFVGIGVGNKSATGAPALPFSFGASRPEHTPTFSFGKPPVAEKPEPVTGTPKPAVEAPKPVVEAPKPSTSPFSFAPVQPAEKPAAPSPAPSFSFGAPPAPAPVSTPTPPIALAPAPVPAPTPAPAASLAPPTFSFGAPPTSTPAIAAPTPQPAASPFSFGVPAPVPGTSSPAPTAPEPPKKSPFEFSAPAASPAPAPAQPEAPKKSPFDFSAAPAPTTSKSPFEFSSAAKPAEKPASPFAFSAPAPAPAPLPAPAPAATEKKSPFDFSSIPKPVSASFTFGTPTPTPAAPATNGFTFGAPAPPRPATPPSGGDAAMEESPTREPAKIVTSGFGNNPGFGAQPPSSGFAFGNTNGTSASSTGPFGGPLNTASAPQTNGFGGSAAPASPAPFAFGTNNGTGSGFGSNGFNTNGSAMPAGTPAFTFGTGGGFPQSASASASPPNPFTQPTTNTPFGQPNPAPSNAFPTPASPFPAASPALSAVGFNTNSAPSNAFGSTQPATNGFPGSPATQPGFMFGANAPTAGTASPSTFTFGLPAGGAPSPATPTATSAPFVFGQAPEQGSPAAGVQFNLGTADASPGGRKIKPLRRPRRN